MRRWITATLTAALVLWGAMPAMAYHSGPSEYDVAFFIAAEFDDVEVDTVRNLHDSGLGYGGILRLTVVALVTDQTLDEIVDDAVDEDGELSDDLGELLRSLDPALVDGLPKNLGWIIANAKRKAHGLDPLPVERPGKPDAKPAPPAEKPDDSKKGEGSKESDDSKKDDESKEHDDSKEYDDSKYDESEKDDGAKDEGSGDMTAEEFEQRYKELEARKAEAYEVYKQCIKESETTLYAGKDAVYAEIERLTIEKQQKVEALYAQLKEATTDEEYQAIESQIQAVKAEYQALIDAQYEIKYQLKAEHQERVEGCYVAKHAVWDEVDILIKQLKEAFYG